jgi:DNA-binding HxlR family transcriptional regulator
VAAKDEATSIVRKLLSEDMHSHMVILVFLYKAGKATLSDLQRALTGGRYRAQYNWTLSIINELKQMDLVTEEHIQIKKVKVRLFDLTEKGMKVAEKISEILSLT